MDILSTHGIIKRYANHTALNNVSISVPEKSIYGLLGPNGAGKTSLIRIINQITGPDSGHVLFDGKPLQAHHTNDIGYLPEERGLYKKMTVGDQVIYLARLKGLSRNDALKKIKYWFEKFEIQAWWNKKIEELSKGMQQKIQFVVTVLHEPRLLILDEPFSGFDPINANLIKNEILELKEKGTSIIFSTHNMGSVEELCDYIGLINNAEKILDGAVTDIRKTYKTNTYELTFAGNMIAFTTALWAGFELLDKQETDGLCKVKVKLLNDNTVNNMLKQVLPVVEIQALQELIPSMNDIFISKVNEQDLTLKGNLTE
jgi:ABC-2 type transport system ATP-binding protein